jgi:hypothetical protein
MQQLIKVLVLSVTFCLLSSGSIAQKSQSRTPKSRPAIICKTVEVPNGMVVVGYKRNSACSNSTELLVKQPETGDIICDESPVPPQFSVVTEAQGNSVGTCPNKAFLITRTNQDSETQGRVADDSIARAFASRTSDIQVAGEGIVIRVLADDLDQPRHQRFIVQLGSGQTVLIAHNIDVAPRIVGLEAGDSVRFNGEYVWNAKGGTIHWTHHDPRGKHVAGWVIHDGKTYK